jgi:sulfotransferase
VYGECADRLLLVRYESLVADPLKTLAGIYNFIGEPLYTHDPGHIEPDHRTVEFDVRLGTPGLHDVHSAVQVRPRQTVLPPDVFARYERDAFWQVPAQVPMAVRMV